MAILMIGIPATVALASLALIGYMVSQGTFYADRKDGGARVESYRSRAMTRDVEARMR